LSLFDGNDEIVGLFLRDILLGYGGNDAVTGGDGDDTLNGGIGDDTLTGGDDADTFVFGPDGSEASSTLMPANGKAGQAYGLGLDRITDFNVKEDTIVLDADYFGFLKIGKLNKKAFFVGKKADDGKDRIIYNDKKGSSFLMPTARAETRLLHSCRSQEV